MERCTFHPLGTAAPLTIAGVAALVVASAVTPAAPDPLRALVAEAKLLNTELWVIGGSGQPIPSADDITAVSQRYIDPTAFPDFNGGQPMFPDQPVFPVDGSNPLFTPEGLYPITGVKSLEFDPSLAQGVTILDDTITRQLAAGNSMVIEGDSQGAVIEGQEMKHLLTLPVGERPDGDQLTFVMTGDESNPNGGLLERFNLPDMPQLTVPSFGISFIGAAPADTPWNSVEYIGEYDGFSDYPRYPIDFLADVNAVLGMAFVHLHYSDFTPEQLADAITLPVTDDYTGHTDYIMLPQTLPLADALQLVPVVGKPLADLLGPDLKILVDLGYGHVDSAADLADNTGGWDHGPANVPTPMGLFPDVNLSDVFDALVAGTKQGVADFVHDLGSTTPQSLLDGLRDTVSSAGAGGDPLSSLTDLVNTVSGDLANGYAALLPLADTLNTLLTTIPAYDAALFAHEISSGNLLDAIGLPIAADLGLLPPLAVFGLSGVLEGLGVSL